MVNMKSKRMRYMVKLGMEGAFPGSPDWSQWEISSQMYDAILEMLKQEVAKGRAKREW